MTEEELDKLDHIILNKIAESKDGINTYELDKRIDSSWSTINTRCYRLCAMGKVTSIFINNFSRRKERIWKTKK